MADVTNWVTKSGSRVWAFIRSLLARETLLTEPLPDEPPQAIHRTFCGDLFARESLGEPECVSTAKPRGGGWLREILRFDPIPPAPALDSTHEQIFRSSTFITSLFSREPIEDDTVNKGNATANTQEIH